MRRFHNIRFEVATLAKDLVERCHADLPQEPCALAGEVLEVWRRGDRWQMTLRDVQEDLAIAASLPASEPRPREGCTLSIIGRYEVELDPVDASFRLVFDGKERDPDWKVLEPTRRRERRERIESLRAELPFVELEKEPHRVALVTSRGSAAIEDFKVGLGNMESEVHCAQVVIPLEEGSVDDTAAGIRRAGTLDVDVVVIARGGGQKIKLERFSDVKVLTAIAETAARVPVIVAIGHERDRLEADRLAWRRASTPNDAGVLVGSEIRIRRWREKQRREKAALALAASSGGPAPLSPVAPAMTGLDLGHTRASASPTGRRVATNARPVRTHRRRSVRGGVLAFAMLLAGLAYSDGG